MLAIIEVVYYCLKTILFWILVLLKILLIHNYLQFFETFHHPITQNLTILVSIHLFFNLYKHSQPICPHTIRLFHPSHPTVADVGQYEMNLILFFHTYTTLFDPIIFIIALSDYKTVFESSTVQFSCS